MYVNTYYKIQKYHTCLQHLARITFLSFEKEPRKEKKNNNYHRMIRIIVQNVRYDCHLFSNT